MQTWRTSRLSNTWTLSTFDSLYSGRDPARYSKIWALICGQCLNTDFHIWLPLHLNLNRTAFTASGVRSCHVEECQSKIECGKGRFEGRSRQRAAVVLRWKTGLEIWQES